MIRCLALVMALFVSDASAAAPHTAVKAAAAVAERYSGEALIAGDPLPVHLEIRRSADQAMGVFSTPSGTFELTGVRGSAVAKGNLQQDAVTVGTIILRFIGDRIEGDFTVGGQGGTLHLTRTAQDAISFLKPQEQQTALTAAQWREDLDRLVDILTTKHGAPFHRTSRATFFAHVEQLRAAIPTLAGEEIAVEFRRLAALIGDGHTGVASISDRPLLPIQTYWFEDGLRVTLATSGNEHLLGARVLAVNGVPVQEVLDRLRAFIGQGETEWAYRGSAPALLRTSDILNRAGVGSGPVHSFTVQTADGRLQEASLTATTEKIEWNRLGGDRPLWQRNPDHSFWTEQLPNGAIYINWRTYDGLQANVSRLMRELDRTRPPALIIDLRSNTGGDFHKGRALVRAISNRPWLNKKGRLFVLIGRSTFSAAMTNAVDFKTKTKATLVGEPAGAAPNNWQEVKSYSLPHSRLSVSVSTKYYTFLPGEAAVRPDIHLPPHPSDWGSRYDRALRHIIETFEVVSS